VSSLSGWLLVGEQADASARTADAEQRQKWKRQNDSTRMQWAAATAHLCAKNNDGLCQASEKKKQRFLAITSHNF